MNAWKDKRRTDEAISYLFGKCESFIEIYARSAELSARELAHGVARALLAEEIGEVLGAQNPLSALRGNSSSRNQSVEQVEVAGGSHRGAQVVRSYTRRGPHWTQLPENRPKLMKHLREMQRARGVQAKRNPTSLKGFSYEGRHWTQQPKNKARLRAQMRRVHKTYVAKIRKGK